MNKSNRQLTGPTPLGSHTIYPVWVSFHWPAGEELENLSRFTSVGIDSMSFYLLDSIGTEPAHIHDSVHFLRLVEKGTTITGAELKTIIRNSLGEDGRNHLSTGPTLAFSEGKLVVLYILVNGVDFLIKVRPIHEEASYDYISESGAAAHEMLLEVFSKYTPEQAAKALMHKRMKDLPRVQAVLEAVLQGINLTGSSL